MLVIWDNAHLRKRLRIAKRLPELTNVAVRQQVLQQSGFSQKNMNFGLRTISCGVYRMVCKEFGTRLAILHSGSVCNYCAQ